MESEGIRPGSVVHVPRWPEPVAVGIVEDVGEYVQAAGAAGITSQSDGMH